VSGWRDSEGRTRAARRQEERAAGRTRFMERVRNRPLSFVGSALFALLILIVIAALVLR